MSVIKKEAYTYTIQETGQRISVTGRDAWALQQLVKAGATGCTPINQPAPRWSAYVHNLRKLGIDIATIYEAHGGQFAGIHGRYVLKSNLALQEAANG
jgi:hypothetical protein